MSVKLCPTCGHAPDPTAFSQRQAGELPLHVPHTPEQIRLGWWRESPQSDVLFDLVGHDAWVKLAAEDLGCSAVAARVLVGEKGRKR